MTEAQTSAMAALSSDVRKSRVVRSPDSCKKAMCGTYTVYACTPHVLTVTGKGTYLGGGQPCRTMPGYCFAYVLSNASAADAWVRRQHPMVFLSGQVRQDYIDEAGL